MREATRRSRHRWRRPLVATLAGAIVLSLAGGGVALALAGRSGDRYTTATATLGSVEQTVPAAGTVASATRRDVSFPVDGTVESVLVRLGDTVTAGQVLASLDPVPLQNALDAANQALQEAQQRLSDDLESQTATSSSSSGSSPSSSDAASGDAEPSDAGDSTSTPNVTRETQAVVAAQQALLARYDEARAALGTSTQALADAQTRIRE